MPASGAMRASLTRSTRELEERVAQLEAANGTLRIEAQRSAERAEFQVVELEHRLKNTFTTIQALAAQTARPGDTGQSFRASFDARLLALAHSHELLRSSYAEGASLAELLRQCLQPYENASCRIGIVGPMVHLPARDVPILGLTFHELTTNAAKYGALSTPEGRVDVMWQLEARETDQKRTVVISWRERGGPPVKTPDRRGFGLRLVERGMAHEFGTAAQFDFGPQGVNCCIRLPLDSVHGVT